MVALAWLFPAPGLAEQPISLEELASYGVAGIFFFYGLKLDFAEIKKGLANWHLHLIIQLTTFLLFPLVALAIRPFFSGVALAPLWLGIFYLCALPSTVSSSVVMVSIANGNIPSAIFNASISSLIGVFVTPLWVQLFISAGTGSFSPWAIIGKLSLQVLLPVSLGILLNSRLGHITSRHKTALKTFDQVIILIIIYTSFCKSFSMGVFHDVSWGAIIMLAIGMMALFFVVLYFTGMLAHLFKFSPADEITAMFCGSKKSLVHGTVMSRILFTGSSITGIILLPLMLYHALQLIAASILAGRMAKRQNLP